MRAKICLLAVLSLAFNLAQVESGCGRPDPCDCDHEQVFENVYKICGCNDFKALGCQLNIDENDSSASCKNNATWECRNATQQYAKQYPDACKESTRLTNGGMAIRWAESCLTSGSGKLTNWPLMFLFMGACLWAR